MAGTPFSRIPRAGFQAQFSVPRMGCLYYWLRMHWSMGGACLSCNGVSANFVFIAYYSLLSLVVKLKPIPRQEGYLCGSRRLPMAILRRMPGTILRTRLKRSRRVSDEARLR
jgi:hypothetical protein